MAYLLIRLVLVGAMSNCLYYSYYCVYVSGYNCVHTAIKFKAFETTKILLRNVHAANSKPSNCLHFVINTYACRHAFKRSS